MDRAEWIKLKRGESEQRMDELWSPIYDDRWGATIEPSHRAMLAKFIVLCPPGATVLDAACGTGKYWSALLEAGLKVHGIDQSAGMLQRAQRKHPQVTIEKLGLQEMAFATAFQAALCMDAMENVFPEDWPGVLANFRRALTPGAPLYLTVELPEPGQVEADFDQARRLGLPVVRGECAWEPGYHYYPEAGQVDAWLTAAGFRLLDEATGDSYRHLLVDRE